MILIVFISLLCLFISNTSKAIHEMRILFRFIVLLPLFICFFASAQKSETHTLSGYITDAKSGEALIGIKVFIPEINKGAITNNYGFYSLTVSSGVYRVEFRSLLFPTEIREISFKEDVALNVELGADVQDLQEVVVNGKKGENVKSTQMGRIELDIESIKAPKGLSENSIKFISKMKKGSYLVNVARGSVVEYQALLAGLDSQQLAGAGLDVFWQEPFDPSDPIMNYNVIATPHIGGATDRSLRGIGGSVAANIKLLKMGTTPLNCANLDEVTRVD